MANHTILSPKGYLKRLLENKIKLEGKNKNNYMDITIKNTLLQRVNNLTACNVMYIK